MRSLTARRISYFVATALCLIEIAALAAKTSVTWATSHNWPWPAIQNLLEPWAKNSFFPQKPIELLFFIFLISSWTVLLSLIAFWTRSIQNPSDPSIERTPPAQCRNNWIWHLLWLGVVVDLFFMAWPFMNRRLYMMNEYLSVPEQTRLDGALVNNLDFISRNRIDGLHLLSSSDDEPKDSEQRIQEFTALNQREMHWQIYNRWVIHHHNFILAPLNELQLGKSTRELNAQYGLLNLWFFKWATDALGGLRYETYFQAWYFFFVAYYLLWMVLCVFLLRDARYVILGSLCVVGCLGWLGYDYLLLGSGLNPIRHALDLPVMFALVFYFRRPRSWLLLAVALLTGVAMLNNHEFGLFLEAAFLCAWVFFNVLESRKPPRMEVLIILASVALTIFLEKLPLENNPLLPYYIMGLVGFPLRPLLKAFFIINLFIVFAAMAWLCSRRSRARPLTFFAFFYAMGTLIYIIWGATRPHAFCVASVFILPALLWLQAFYETRSKKEENTVLSILACIFVVGVFIPSVIWFTKTRTAYMKTFLTHRVYSWNLDRAHFVSTMDPDGFSQAVELIHRYNAKGPQIYLLSRYDNFIPFLAGRYSAMPFFDMTWYFMTNREIQQTIALLEKDSPEFIFVDTDIDRPLAGEIATSGTPDILVESNTRAQRMGILRMVFMKISSSYVKVDESPLISVYRRKSSSMTNAY